MFMPCVLDEFRNLGVEIKVGIAIATLPWFLNQAGNQKGSLLETYFWQGY